MIKYSSSEGRRGGMLVTIANYLEHAYRDVTVRSMQQDGADCDPADGVLVSCDDGTQFVLKLEPLS